MRISWPGGDSPERRRGLAIGNFDGVHRGHAAVVARLAIESARRGDVPTAMTFEPHTRSVLGEGGEPERLTGVACRRALLVAAGAESVAILHFDGDVAAMSPEAFVAALVADPVRARLWVVSSGFRFGRRGAGDVAWLQREGPALGVETVVVPPTLEGEEAVSSTRIRACLRDGQVAAAARLLGRPHRLSGMVVRGRALGRCLGFPTANLVEIEEMVPAEGIYAAWAAWDGEVRPAAVHVGRRLTFDGDFTVEAHLCDWEGDLYDRRIHLAFVERLRDDVRFDGAEALARQIGEDVARVRRELVSPPRPIGIGEECSGPGHSPMGP